MRVWRRSLRGDGGESVNNTGYPDFECLSECFAKGEGYIEKNTMYPSPLAKSIVTYYRDISRIKKPIHIITCSSCTCAPLYANYTDSFNSQPVKY